MNYMYLGLILMAAAAGFLVAQSGGDAAPASVHDFTMKDINGKEVDLSTYRGKTLLVVNVASKCGHTVQYATLEKLYKDYADKGLVVLGFPANNFGNQEPGTNEEIAEFCRSTYGVSFPMFSKVSVKGDDKHPLYQYLTTQPQSAGEVGWNFTKFLVDGEGKVVARFNSGVKPDSPEVIQAIEAQLKK